MWPVTRKFWVGNVDFFFQWRLPDSLLGHSCLSFDDTTAFSHEMYVEIGRQLKQHKGSMTAVNLGNTVVLCVRGCLRSILNWLAHLQTYSRTTRKNVVYPSTMKYKLLLLLLLLLSFLAFIINNTVGYTSSHPLKIYFISNHLTNQLIFIKNIDKTCINVIVCWQHV